MRISVLDIPAFGPFTDFRHEFTRNSDTDFHIFLGNNESGKSSLLRAISDLLYGIPQRTPENFRHDYRKLLLQAELYNSRNERLSIKRRKAKADNQLTTEDGAPLSQEQLSAFMGNLSRDNFQSLFGLGAEELQQGNDLLLSTHGALAETIAAASSGSLHLSHAVQSLLQQSEKIYKRNGNSQLRDIRKNIKDLEIQMRTAVTRPQAWNDLNQQLTTVQNRQELIRKELEELDQAINHTDRMKQGIELVGQLNRRQRELDELGLPAKLVSGFAKNLTPSLANWQTANNAKATAEKRVDRLKSDLEQLDYRKDVIAAEEAIDQVNANLNIYKDRVEQAVELRHVLSSRKLKLDTELRKFSDKEDSEGIGAIRLSSAQELNCSEKYSLYSELIEESEILEKEIDSVRAQLLELQSQYAGESSESGETDASAGINADFLNTLNTGIETGHQQLPIAKKLPLLEDELDRKATELDLLISRLSMETRLDDVRGAAVPRRETLNEYRDKFENQSRQKEKLQSESVELDYEISKIETELASLLGERVLPSRKSLQSARDYRDQLWGEFNGTETTESGSKKQGSKNLVSAIDKAIIRADGVADELIFNAQLVAETDQKKESIKLLKSKRSNVQAQQEQLIEQEQAIKLDWKGVWSGIKSNPESPASMLDWYDDWQKACQAMAELEKQRQLYQQQISSVSESSKRLSAIPGLLPSSETGKVNNEHDAKFLEALINAASNKKKKIDESQGAIQRTLELQNQYKEKLTRLNSAKDKLDIRCVSAEQEMVIAFADIGINVKRIWTEHTKSGYKDKTPPLSATSAQRLLEDRCKLLDSWGEFERDEKHLQQLDALIAEYQKEVGNLAEKFHIKQNLDNTELLCNQLVQLRREQRSIFEKRQNLENEFSKDTRLLSESADELQRNSDLLADFLVMFGVNSPTDLLAMQSKFVEADGLMNEIRVIKDNLSVVSAASDLQAFIAEVLSHDPDRLVATGAGLKSKKLELVEENESLIANKALLQKQLDEVHETHGSGADIRQNLELALVEQRQAILEFVKTRLVADMLKQTLEDYRDKNEGPLINDASSMFKRLTCNIYERIALAYTDDEQPYIKGERANGEQVQVDAMSDGTRDQLYLSMRLAALKMRLNAHEPMPLIVDDLLITFDDVRTEAAMDVLLDISNQTQVILFTHHARVADVANSKLSEKDVQITDLTAAQMSA